MTRTYDFSKISDGKHLIDHFPIEHTLGLIFGNRDLKLYHRDMFDLARAVVIADRYSPRAQVAGQRDTSAREIAIILPVREVSRFVNPITHSKLISTLNFLTQDNWEITFVSRKAINDGAYPPLPENLVDRYENIPKVFGLFSSGLDSVAGITIEISRNPQKAHMVVSASSKNSESTQREGFNKIYSAIMKSFPGRADTLTGVMYSTQIDKEKAKEFFADQKIREEFTQRSRGFLFLMLGTISAEGSGESDLYVFENGVGAINLPYSHATIGADNTRSMHPLFIAYMSDLMSKILAVPFKIINPYWFKTKGLLVKELKDLGHGGLVNESISCDTYGFRDQMKGSTKERPHCGQCSSCILRRTSTLYATTLDTKYRNDPVHLIHNLTSLDAERRTIYVQMIRQIASLKLALEKDKPFEELTIAFPDIRLAYDGYRLMGYKPEFIMKNLVKMYKQYILEWDNMVKKGE